MSDYPNIDAVLNGTVSGHYSEWPLLRIEIRALQEQNMKMREALERLLTAAKLRYQAGRDIDSLWMLTYINEALQDTPEGGCEHGRDMTEYCQECGRINGRE